MKLFFTLLLIVIVIVGGYLYWQSRSSSPTTATTVSGIAMYGDNTPIEYTGTEEEQKQFIQSAVDKSKSDLRTIGVALDSYYVDFNTYPRNLFMVSTPIAYLVSVPKDPFTKSSYMKYVKKDKDFLIWSIGPDLKNNDGSAKYQGTQGEKSAGDIIRTTKEY